MSSGRRREGNSRRDEARGICIHTGAQSRSNGLHTSKELALLQGILKKQCPRCNAVYCLSAHRECAMLKESWDATVLSAAAKAPLGPSCSCRLRRTLGCQRYASDVLLLLGSN